MVPKIIKLILCVLILGYAGYQFYDENIGNGIFYTLIAGFVILIYFKNEFIFFAFLRLRKEDFEGTKRWLNKIKNPKSALVKKQQGYYNYLNGLIASQTNLTQAEKFFRTALKLGLSMAHDKAMAKMSLAGILLQKRRKREATALLSEAKKLDKYGMLKDQIRLMQQQMKRI